MAAIRNSRIDGYAAATDDFGGPDEPVKPPAKSDPEEPTNSVSAWLQYLYFLRCPLMGLLSLPVLCALDYWTGVSALSRGIVTMSRAWQAFYAAFFVAALMNACLICAKNIVRNGEARFSSAPPGALSHALLGSSTATVNGVLFAAHVPTFLTLLYVGCVTYQEKEMDFYIPLLGRAYWHIWVWFAVGLIAALVFWYGVTLFYLWIYPNYPPGHPRYRAAALLLPPTLPGMEAARNAPEPRIAKWIANALMPLTRLSHDGYADAKGAAIWEFHSLAAVALGWFLLTYLFLYPLTAPVVLNRRPVAGCLLAAAIGLILLWGTRERKRSTGASLGATAVDLRGPVQDRTSSNASPSAAEKAALPVSSSDIAPSSKVAATTVVVALRLLLLFAVGTFVALLLADAHDNSVRLENSFPVLASVTVILVFLQWLLSGASFFFDRFRLPVFTMLLGMLVLSKVLLGWINQEHYFEANDTTRASAVDTPSEATATRIRQHPGEPYIIVTASGGGIQAAEWTAQVMAQFETTFRDDPALQHAGYTFHDHLLLASGVSGGSVGLMPFLLEYTAPASERFGTREVRDPEGHEVMPDLLSRRLTRAPECSSLEAVAWGLEYYDLQRLLLTVRIPILQRGRAGASPDRTWALSEAFNRNLTDRHCGTDPQAQRKEESFDLLSRVDNGQKATLKTTAALLHSGAMPAFSFNTTVVETGGRFLLSNYAVPAVGSAGDIGSDFLPAESFLQAYAQEPNCRPGDTKCFYADLPLATAARLSATFPLVSSATRIPQRFARRASHFVDGGYFDNDGTSSVTEFLYSALRKGVLPAGAKILLVEVRDSDDLDPTTNIDDLRHQTGAAPETGVPPPKAWKTKDQILAPVEGLWQAGHESVTRRNRRELCLLETAYGTSHGSQPFALEIHHLVLGIKAPTVDGHPDQPKSAPLSWKLTTGQRQYIEKWATDPPTQNSIQKALAWVKENMTAPGEIQTPAAPPADDPCTVVDQTYMRSKPH